MQPNASIGFHFEKLRSGIQSPTRLKAILYADAMQAASPFQI